MTGTVTHVVVGLRYEPYLPRPSRNPTGQPYRPPDGDANVGRGWQPRTWTASTSHSMTAPPACWATKVRLCPGRYRPSAYATFWWPAFASVPAPPEPYGPGLAEFNGTQPTGVNGAWNLYVNDAAAGDTGFIGAWNITIFTDAGGLPGARNPVPCGKPDFDGDGRADTVVYQDATGNWFVVGSAVGFFTPALNFGGPGFISVAGDYDGDGITDPAVYHTSSGNWFAVGSSTGFFNVALNFGGPGFTPVPGDYDGDGKTDAAVYQTSTGNWFVVGSTDGFFSVLNFGGSGFSPVPAAQ